jgi:hypothetical protein
MSLLPLKGQPVSLALILFELEQPERKLRIPIDSDHSFRSNPIADSGVSDHLAGAGVS